MKSHHVKNNARQQLFQKLVLTRFNIYNGLFIDLPYEREKNVGVQLPILTKAVEQGLEKDLSPQEILARYFRESNGLNNEEDQIDFMFRVIQYVERQVVLYDSVEDAAFSDLSALKNTLGITDYIELAKKKKKDKEITEFLRNFSARLVFTAHPTQFYPPAILDIIAELRILVKENKLDQIDDMLKQLGLTSLLNREKPTPLDEARNIIYYLRHVYYDAIGSLFSELKQEMGEESFDNTDIVRMGFWPGGDRDGNPFVTAAVTATIADELRMTLLKCYYQDIKALQKKLTFKKVDSLLEKLRSRIYTSMFDARAAISYEEIIEPLTSARELLTSDFHSINLADLDAFMDKVRIFRTHFATLDIRQNHQEHEAAIQFLLKKEGLIKNDLSELSEEALIDILLHKRIPVKDLQIDEPLIADTLKNIAQLADIQARNGEEGCNRYIISNSEDIYAVLFVYAMIRWSRPEGAQISFDIIPLFESMAGMKNSRAIMEKLFSLPEYMAQVKSRNATQTMMMGFSDGTKDGGYLKANWSIYKTKENLTDVCRKYNVKPIFFDGRGGPPARGGGKTHRFYAAQSDLIANHEIQLTIQGQTITSTYGSKEQFSYNCLQMLGAGLSNAIYGEENKIAESHRKVIERLSESSFKKYNALKEHPMFIPYLEKKSTLKYYTKANIGSRPGKRGGDKKLTLSDLRAISFVGSWSQLKQNVPGYFGIGTALQEIIDEGGLADLKSLYKEVAIFRALVHNSMMSLTKTNFKLTSYMAEDQEYGAFWNILRSEYELTKKLLLQVADYEILMQEESLSRMSIEIRERIVLPLLVIQQYALQCINERTAKQEQYEKLVTRSLYGNINASRNSA